MNRDDFIFSTAELRAYLEKKQVSSKRIQSIIGVDHPFRLLVPYYYLDLIHWEDPQDPLAKMVLISDLENDVREYEHNDPIGDRPHEPVAGIIHRHRDRCLLMLTNSCAVHCRFCFRKNLLEDNRADFAKSIQYIRDHEEIWEVILSGGDPFTFTDHFTQLVLNALRTIRHVKMMRFHTRTPAVYPKRVTEAFSAILGSAKPITVVIHINHPREITPDFCHAVTLLQKSGVLLLSQSVLLKGVNDSTQTLATLFKSLVEIGIKPYYLHHLDPALGTHYFRLSVNEGKALYQALQQSLSGLCIPQYVIDVPGGHGKVPVFSFKEKSPGVYEGYGRDNRLVIYKDFAAGR